VRFVLKGVLFVLIVLGCAKRATVRFAIPTEDGGLRLRSLTEALVASGLLKDLNEVAQIPFVFTVVDSSEKPVPRAELLVKFKDKVERYQADGSGRVTLRFDSTTVERNPLIAPGVKGQELDFSFAIGRELGAEPGKLNIVDTDSLLVQQANGCLIYYPRGYDSIAIALAAYFPKARLLIKEVTGLEPIRWGTVLADKSLPVVLAETEVEVEGESYHFFPFSLIDGTAKDWYLVNLHEWVENTLIANLGLHDPTTRWIRDGIAEFVKYKMISKIPGGPIQNELIVATKQELEGILQYLKTEENKGNKEIVFDLLAWESPGPRQLISEQDVLGYRLSLWFWWDTDSRYGSKVIREFLANAKRSVATKNRDFLEVLAEVTGNRNIRTRLHEFDISEMASATENLLNELSQ